MMRRFYSLALCSLYFVLYVCAVAAGSSDDLPEKVKIDLSNKNLQVLKNQLGKSMLNLQPANCSASNIPIDVVYTWVNGSDTQHIREKMKYLLNTEGTAKDGNALNRFIDNSELQISLRSLAKNANWIRNVYIVTSGQVPSWLNVANPRVKVIPHKEIFSEEEALPTFNSAAIEANIHNIPGLSDKFLYLNDDFYFWDKTTLADFIDMGCTQKVYFSNRIPDCAMRCPYQLLGNGKCDPTCNTLTCEYDRGDCLGVGNATVKPFASYDASLAFSNMMLHKRFGRGVNLTPPHMPHLLDKNIVTDMHLVWPQEFKQSSENRFRSRTDVQHAFTYFQYLIHESRQKIFTYAFDFLSILDWNGSRKMESKEADNFAEIINSNMRLLSFQHPGFEFVFHLAGEEFSLSNPIDSSTLQRALRNDSSGVIDEKAVSKSDIVHIMSNMYQLKRHQNFVQFPATSVGFFMLTSPKTADEIIKKIKEKKPKFLCINDDLDHSRVDSDVAVEKLNKFLLESLPAKSEFEL